MPMIEYCKFHRNDVTRASFNTTTSQVDFTAQVEPPLGIGTRSIENCRNVVFEDYRGEKADVDISGELENIFILPRM